MNKSVVLVLFSTVLMVASFVPALGQSDAVYVYPKNGDGIRVLLRRHNFTKQAHFDEFLTLNSGKFGRNNSLILGRKYLLPTSENADNEVKEDKKKVVNSVNIPLFGKKHALTEIEDNKLEGAVFYLVSGHGGPDPGAIGKREKKRLPEDEYAYDVTIRLAKKLISHSAEVHMIIRDDNDGIRDEEYLVLDKDETCGDEAIPLNQISRLKQRTNRVNELHKEDKGKHRRLVTIHVDSRSTGKRVDIFFYHYAGSSSGERLANRLHQAIKEKYEINQPSRGYHGTVSARNLYMLRKSLPPAVYIELGNICNTLDQKRFIVEDNRQAMANWLALGLIKDYELSRPKKDK